MEDSRDAVDEVGRNMRRLESSLLVEVGDCRRSGDGLEKRLSKLEGVCGRLDGVSDSINKLNQGTSGRSFFPLGCSRLTVVDLLPKWKSSRFILHFTLPPSGQDWQCPAVCAKLTPY